MPIKKMPSAISTLPFEGAIDQSDVVKGASTKAQRQEFFLPISGFVWFYPEEVAVIDHPAFQRLGRINQLGQAHYAFRGATHKRIEHVLGVVHIAQKMISSVNFNVEKSKAKQRSGFCAPLSEREQRFIRLGALLHDIGHVAAGHTLEDELELIGKHDADERLDLILEKGDWDSASGTPTQTLRDLINEQYEKYVPQKLASNGLRATDIVRILIRKPPEQSDKYAGVQAHINDSAEIRYHVCTNMIGNTICADLLDYLFRDWYHVGKPRTPDDRIFQYMEIRRGGRANQTQSSSNPERHVDDRFVIALGQQTKIRSDGVSAILGLLEWRYDLAEMVLFHRTKLAAGAMLDRALYELWEGKDEAHLIDKVLPLSDDQLLDEAIKEADRLRHEKSEKADPKLSAAASLLRKLRDRDLFRELATFDSTNLAKRSIPEIQKTYAMVRAGGTSGAKHRAEAARVLETDFNLPAGSIAIYCSHIRPKIAEVSIAVDTDVMKFNEYEKKNRNRLSGGHLEAQIERFERLWRIYFFIDAEVEKNLQKEMLLLLQQTVEQVVLADGEPSQLIPRAKEKALHYVHQERERGNNGIEFVDELITAARHDPAVAALRTYPNGAPSIRSFIRQK